MTSIKQRLADWLSTKASAVSPLIYATSIGRAVWTPRKYDKLAEEGYQKNVVAFKAVNELMTGASQAPWLVYRVDRSGNRVEASESPLAVLMRRPNPQQGGSAFFAALTGYYNLSGNAYIEAVSPGPGRPPLELYTQRPDRMKVVPTKNGPAYEYTVQGQKRTFAAEDAAIRHLRTFNPLSDWYGMSPLEAAACDVDIHNSALAWNKSLLDNGARPSGAMVYTPKDASAPDTLPEESYNRLKQQMEDQYTGARNTGRPLLLEGGLSWQQFSLSPADMDYINSKHTTARDICMAFGVPPQLLGIPGDNTYSNMREARLALWEQTIIPWLYSVRDELNAWLVPQFGDEFRLDIDEDAVPALQPRRDELWNKLQTSDFLTINEKRAAVGYAPVTGGDDVLTPATMLPLGFVPDESAGDTEKGLAEWLESQGYDTKTASHIAAAAFEEGGQCD